MPAPRLPDPPHGTTRRYWLRRDPCRCRPCRQAIADYHAAYRARRAGRPHQLRLDPGLRLDLAAEHAPSGTNTPGDP